MKKGEKLVEVDIDGTEMSEIQNTSEVRPNRSNQTTHNNGGHITLVQEPDHPPFVQVAPRRSLRDQLLLHKNTILKWVMIVCILVFAVYLGMNFFSENLRKSRKPMFLSAFSMSNGEEVMSPQQSDYKSFKHYKKMVELAKNVSLQNRDATQQEINKLSDIKFRQFYNSYKVIHTIQLGEQFMKTPKEKEELGPVIDQTNLDQSINLTNYFADAVDQFECASCYSFPIAATVEYMYKYYYNITVKLSEQQLIDCAHQDQNANGCNDGNITKGFEYVVNTGLVTTEEYPYRSITGQSFKCDKKTIQKAKKYKISGFKKLPSGNCQAIQSQLVKNNVVAAMINAGDLPKYTNGTFTDCKRFGWNHAITIVGQTQKNEWIVRNSWGKSWGNYGYFVMGHGNTCGVCTHSIVPVLKMNKQGQVQPYNPDHDGQEKSKQ